MAPKVNGSGNGDGNDLYAQLQAYYEALRAKGGKTEKTDDTAVVIPPPVNNEINEENLLSADYRSYFGLKFSNPEEAKIKADLEALPKTSLANVTRADRKEAFNAVSDPLVQAYMYGQISENTFAAFSKFDGTTFPPEVTKDLLARVVIDAT